MDIQEAMKRIETGLEIIKVNPDKVKNLLHLFFKLLDRVSVADKKKCLELKTKFVDAANSPDVRTTIVKIEEIAENIKTLKEKVKIYGINPYADTYLGKYHGMTSVNDSDKGYIKALDKYKHKLRLIKEKEENIIVSKEYVKNLHELISNHKRYEGYFHARLTGNLRIMYIMVTGTLIFKDIITKNEFDSRR